MAREGAGTAGQLGPGGVRRACENRDRAASPGQGRRQAEQGHQRQGIWSWREAAASRECRNGFVAPAATTNMLLLRASKDRKQQSDLTLGLAPLWPGVRRTTAHRRAKMALWHVVKRRPGEARQLRGLPASELRSADRCTAGGQLAG